MAVAPVIAVATLMASKLSICRFSAWVATALSPSTVMGSLLNKLSTVALALPEESSPYAVILLSSYRLIRSLCTTASTRLELTGYRRLGISSPSISRRQAHDLISPAWRRRQHCKIPFPLNISMVSSPMWMLPSFLPLWGPILLFVAWPSQQA